MGDTITTHDPHDFENGDKIEIPFFSRESWPLVDREVYRTKRMICTVTSVIKHEIGIGKV